MAKSKSSTHKTNVDDDYKNNYHDPAFRFNSFGYSDMIIK